MASDTGQELVVRLPRQYSEQHEHVVDIDVGSRKNSAASTSMVEGVDPPSLGGTPRAGVRGMTVAFKVRASYRQADLHLRNLGQSEKTLTIATCCNLKKNLCVSLFVL